MESMNYREVFPEKAIESMNYRNFQTKISKNRYSALRTVSNNSRLMTVKMMS